MTSTDFITRIEGIVEVIHGQLTWLETNEELLENAPQKSIENLHIEHELIDYSSKVAAKPIAGVGKLIDKGIEFYKRVLTTHNRCHTTTSIRL